jgi:hypothetical protein
MARTYEVAGYRFQKVAEHRGGKVHVVEEVQFWEGERSWEHRTIAGESVAGTPVSLQRVSCPRCREAVKRLNGHG